MADRDTAADPPSHPDLDGPASEQAVLERAAQLAAAGDLAAAQRLIERADEGGSREAALQLGRLLDERGDLDGAESAYRRADQRGSAEGAFLLGLVRYERGDLAGAQAALSRADARDSAEGARNLGVILQERGDLEAAEAAFRRADQRGSADAAASLGALLEQRGDLAAAEAAYRRADEEGSAGGACMLGEILQERGDLAGAQAAFTRADERGSAEAARYLGVILHQRGDLAGAEAAFRRADERDSAAGAVSLGSVLYQRGDLAGAEAAYRRADERGSGLGTQLLIQLLLANGDHEQADDLCRDALKGSDAERAFAAAFGLGQALKDLNMPGAAEDPARRAAMLKPDSGAACWLLAAIFTMQGQAGKAEETLRAGLEAGIINRPAADTPAPEAPQPDGGPAPVTASPLPSRSARRRFPLRAGGLAGVFSSSSAIPREETAAAADLKAVQALAERLTFGFAQMLAGQDVAEFPVPPEIFYRLQMELSPLRAADYAYWPNFGEKGDLRVSGNLADRVEVEIRYTDRSARESADGTIFAGNPRRVRLTAATEPPFTQASALDFTVIHGKPAPATVAAGASAGEQPGDMPPWPARAAAQPGRGGTASAGRLCSSGGCQRLPVGRTDLCVGHIGRAGLRQALREHAGTIDARQMPITAEIIEAITDGPLVKPVSFDGASFSTPARFDGCLFLAPVSFAGATFGDVASFTRTTFTQLTSFSGARFLSEAMFGRSRFHGAALFDGAEFRSDATFAKCTFHGGASFEDAQFLESSSFSECGFRTDIHSILTEYFCGAVTFSGALFASPPALGPALATGVCSFDGAAFASDSLVTLEIDGPAVSLVETEFRGGADVLLSPPCEVIVDGAVFARESSLTTWRGSQFLESARARSAEPWARVRLVSVRNAHLSLLRLDDVDLRACRFDGAHGLDQARIEGADVFAAPPGRWRARRPVLAEEWSWRSFSRRGGPKLVPQGNAMRIIAASGERGWAKIPDECTAPAWLADTPGPIPRQRIVAIYRELRKGREDNRDQLTAADLYYSEMEMRSKRDHSSVLNAEKNKSWVERILVRVFWAISGYDVRPVRSLGVLAVVILGAAAVLAQWGYKQDTGFGRAVITALSAATAFFASVDWPLLNNAGKLVEIFLRVSGPVLLALTALGIRARARR